MTKARVCAVGALVAMSAALCARFALDELLGVDADALRVTTAPATHKPLPRERLAVRVNTFRRDDLLRRFLAHYAPCDAVGDIAVVWSDVARAPPAWLVALEQDVVDEKMTGSSTLHVEVHAEDSLNNRFKPLERPAHEAVLSIDDDVFVACATLDAMLDAWALAGRRQMVGLAPRLVSRRDADDAGSSFRKQRRRRRRRRRLAAGGSSSSTASPYAYHRWWRVWWNGAYSLVLTKIAVLARDDLAAYSAEDSAVLVAIRRHVDRHRNCEDLAMSFLVANATNAPPVWLKAPYRDYGQSFQKNAGISSQGDHVEVREDCLALFARLFGRMPLVTGSQKLVPASKEWFW